MDGRLVGWADLGRYSDRAAYAGIAECSIHMTSDVLLVDRLLGEPTSSAAPAGAHVRVQA